MRMFLRFLWVTVLINGVFFLLTHWPMHMADFLAEIAILVIASSTTIVTLIHSPARRSEGFPVTGSLAVVGLSILCILMMGMFGVKVAAAGIGFMSFLAFFCDVRRSDSLLFVTVLSMAEFAITVFCIVRLLPS